MAGRERERQQPNNNLHVHASRKLKSMSQSFPAYRFRCCTTLLCMHTHTHQGGGHDEAGDGCESAWTSSSGRRDTRVACQWHVEKRSSDSLRLTIWLASPELWLQRLKSNFSKCQRTKFHYNNFYLPLAFLRTFCTLCGAWGRPPLLLVTSEQEQQWYVRVACYPPTLTLSCYCCWHYYVFPNFYFLFYVAFDLAHSFHCVRCKMVQLVCLQGRRVRNRRSKHANR